MNCRSVDSSAASGMLLTSPISMQSEGVAPDQSTRSLPKRATSAAVEGSGRRSIRTGTFALLARLFGSERRRGGGHRSGKRLVEVSDDVVDVLDADAEADRFGPDARLGLFFRRHLPVRGRSGMAGER